MAKGKKPAILSMLIYMSWVVGFLAVWATLAVMPLWLHEMPFLDGKRTLPRIGVLGDSLGFANSLINAGAIVAAIITLNLQRQELRRQREESEKATKLAAFGYEIAILQAKVNMLEIKMDIWEKLTSPDFSKRELNSHLLDMLNGFLDEQNRLEGYIDHRLIEARKLLGVTEMEHLHTVTVFDKAHWIHKVKKGAI